MEGSRLERIMHDDPVPRSAREQLARNLRAAELVFEGAYGSFLRVYRFTPAVILGVLQSFDDVNAQACERLGYEIVRRPTGGSAVVVEPERALCYSLFFPSGSIRPRIADLYRGFVLPFAERLGSHVSVDRFFSLLDPNDLPFAGHAMGHHHHNAVTQIDGIVHLDRPDVERFSDLLRLRELYLHGETPIIRSAGSYYSKTGRLLDDVAHDELLFARSERDEIGRMLGAGALGLNERGIVDALRGAAAQHGPFVTIDSFEYGSLERHFAAVDASSRDPKTWNAQGHCFIDF